MELDPGEVRQYLHAAAVAASTDQQGKAYEALAAYLFDCIPGCFTERNASSFFDTEQIDIGVGTIECPTGCPFCRR